MRGYRVSGVGWSDGRVVGCAVMALPGTVLALFLALFLAQLWHRPCPACPSLGPVTLRICTRPNLYSARLPCRPWHTLAPRVHLPHHPRRYQTSPSEQHARPVPGRPLGSLWAAPVARLSELVTCPVNTGTLAPLIGTPDHAPCVTQQRCLTAS